MSETTTQHADLKRAEAQRLEAQAHLLGKNGNAANSLKAATKAVAVWRELAQQDPRFLPDLAQALSHLNIRASRMRLKSEMLAAAIESVKCWRMAADQDFGRYAYGLAEALNQQAKLVAIQDWRDFFAPANEAAQLLLRLLPMDEGRYLEPAALVCLRLSEIGGGTGSPQTLLMYAEKAVELWRRLAKQDLVKHGPQLVRALGRLSLEQVDSEGNLGKAPRREARRVTQALLLLRLLSAVGIRGHKAAAAEAVGDPRGK